MKNSIKNYNASQTGFKVNDTAQLKTVLWIIQASYKNGKPLETSGDTD